MNCPGSALIHESGDTSRAAERGTVLHDEIESCINALRDTPEHLRLSVILKYKRDSIDTEAFSEALHLFTVLGPSIYDFELEATLSVKGIEGETRADAIHYDKNRKLLTVVDFKFGRYEVEAENNPQLMYYALAACDTKKIEPEHTHLVILQPGYDVKIDTVNNEKLSHFRDLLMNAYEAIREKPYYRAGEWCAFCTGKISCGKYVGPIRAKGGYSDPSLEWSLKHLKDIKAWVETVETRARMALEKGQRVEGYRLTPARTNRSWKPGSLDVLSDKGYVVYMPKALSPAQVEKAYPDIDFSEHVERKIGPLKLTETRDSVLKKLGEKQ